MARLDLCINTQTPLVQFLADRKGHPRGETGAVDLARLREGVDYRFSPGGVTRMVYPLLRRMAEDGLLGTTHWVALNPSAPATVRLERVTLHNIALGPERMAQYGRVKEAIWARMHEIDGSERRDDLFWTEAFAQYAYYNRRSSEVIRELDRELDFDTFYVHDFQQLPMGHMLGTLKPKIFRWHIPFDAATVPDAWQPILRTYLASYDTVVVSSRRYATSLKEFGYDGRIELVYPYVDPGDYTHPGPEEVEDVARRFGLAPEEPVVLVVGRMDPIKAQDRAIRAFREVAGESPRAKLVLVGNGSFSGSRGGPGGGKAGRWRAHLEQLVGELDLEGRVVFTGHVDQRELDCLYRRSAFTVLPSVREGFGLVAVESWLHGRPAIVTRYAGVADLMQDGRDGLVFDPERPEELADRMRRLLDDRSGEIARRLVRGGHRTIRQCQVEAAMTAERALLSGAVEA